MILNQSNYHSVEANGEYCSVSQFKDFVGSLGRQGCEAMAVATLEGLYSREVSTAMLVGSYVDAYFEGTLPTFKAQNPDVFTQKGTLKSQFQDAERMIERAEQDELFMKYMSGEKQVIMTAEIFGAKWKCKLDSYIPGVAIVDLKTVRDIHSAEWTKDWRKMNFIDFWGYDIQAAIYQEIVFKNTRERLPFFIAAIEKPTPTKEVDLEIIGFDQKKLDDTLSLVQMGMNRYMSVKGRAVEPDRCGVCNHCKVTKVLTEPIHYSELI